MIEISTRSFIELGNDMPRLRRAVADGSPSILVAGRGDGTPAALGVLQREYALRTVLQDGWSAVPQALLPHGDGALLVLADPGGEPLCCGAGRPPERAMFLKLAVGLATAVSAMHAAGLVHRALTPAKFLVNREARAFLTGFGFATRHGDEDSDWPDSDPEWNDYRFVYMAPELGARRNARVDARADLYSLGCILYQLLTGVPPFDAADTAARVHAHGTHRPRPPAEIALDVPEQISRIIMKLLEKAPEQRYADAAGLLADLQRCEELDRCNGNIPLFALDIHSALQRLQQPDCVADRERAPAASSLHELDIQAMLRISNAPASDIAPARLVETLLRAALENARLYEELVEQNQQRARVEAQLRSALAELSRASRLKAMGELVASIVHEIGQPLAAVDTSASAALRWLNRNPPDIGEAREMLTRIGRSATRVKGIIHALRAKARKAEPQFATLDLNEALREAAALVQGQLDALKVTLAMRGLSQPLLVRGDRIQLQQVVVNLLTNGAESMVALETERRLLLACTVEQGDLVRVSVEDLGSGIAPDIADRLHEPFFTTKESGMGMGLAISHSIVDAHGGTLSLSPREGAGTRATFTLPRRAA